MRFPILLVLCSLGFISDAHGNERLKTLNQIAAAVEVTSPKVNSQKWTKALETSRLQISEAKSAEGLRQAVQSLVQTAPGRLHLVTRDDQVYWMLQAAHDGAAKSLRQIGAFFERRGNSWYVGEVYPGSPAARAGLQRGDEIIKAAGKAFEPVDSFAFLRTAEKAKLQIKRTPWEKPQTLTVSTVWEDMHQSLMRATKQSPEIKLVSNQAIGYFRLWAGGHPDIHQIVRKVTTTFQQDTEKMILDLRGGMGTIAEGMETYFLEGKGQTYSKPLYILINRFTADQKLRLAQILQSSGRAKLVGEHPVGAALSGKVFTIEPRETLAFVPAPSPTLTPDIRIKDTLVYTGGHDTILWKTLKLAVK